MAGCPLRRIRPPCPALPVQPPARALRRAPCPREAQLSAASRLADALSGAPLRARAPHRPRQPLHHGLVPPRDGRDPLPRPPHVPRRARRRGPRARRVRRAGARRGGAAARGGLAHRRVRAAQPRAHRRRRAPTGSQPRGRVHDLQAIFDRLNAEHFGDEIEARIGWGPVRGGRRRRTVKTGVYVQDARIIRIHPTLDRPEVPEFYVATVVFHEMLHQAVPAREVNGRRIVHGAGVPPARARLPGLRAREGLGGAEPLAPPLVAGLIARGGRARDRTRPARARRRAAPKLRRSSLGWAIIAALRCAAPPSRAPPARARRGRLPARPWHHERAVVTGSSSRVSTRSTPTIIEAKLATQRAGASAGRGHRAPASGRGFALDPDALAVDRRRVEAYYRERGYYEARVEDVKVVPDGPGRARVVMRDARGAAGPRHGAPRERPRGRARGARAARQAAARASATSSRVARLRRHARRPSPAALRTTGWANAEVTQSAQVLPGERAAEVTYEVKPGPRLRFGPIFIAGTPAVSRDLVREQASRRGEDRRLVRRVEARDGAGARVRSRRVRRGARDARRRRPGARHRSPSWSRCARRRSAPSAPARGSASRRRAGTRTRRRAGTHRNFLGDLRRLQLDLRAGYAWLPRRSPRKEGAVGLARGRVPSRARSAGASTRRRLESSAASSRPTTSGRSGCSSVSRSGSRRAGRFVPSYNLEVYQLFERDARP